MAEIWEQQPGESDKAFAAFLIFREMQLPRSATGAYRIYRKDPSIKLLPGNWQEWSRKWKWGERATAFDKRLDQVRTSVAEKVIEEMTERRYREIEISALNVVKETAALAHVSIKDVMDWDEEGNVTVKSSKEIPDHVAAAIQKIQVTHDKEGNKKVSVEMHPKVRP